MCRWSAFVLILLIAAGLSACEELVPATAVVVSVKNEVDEVTALRVTISDATSGKANSPALLPIAQSAGKPISFTVAPPAGETRAGFFITVEGLDGSNGSVVSTAATATFAESQTLLMNLRLTKVCKEVVCKASETCHYEPGDHQAGECGPVSSPHLFVYETGEDSDLSFFSPSAAMQGADGGASAVTAILDGAVVSAPRGSDAAAESPSTGGPKPDASVPATTGSSGSNTSATDAGATSSSGGTSTKDAGTSGTTGTGTGSTDAGTRDAGSMDSGTRDAGQGSGAADASQDSGSAAPSCCPSGNCLCHGPAPTQLTAELGGFQTATLTLSTGTAYYPIDATPPFAAVAIVAGYVQADSVMADWGTFYASHGIVAVITTTATSDQPANRGTKLLGSIAELKGLTSGPLAGKLSGRYGVTGYSMGGGGAIIAATMDTTLKTVVGLAPWFDTNANPGANIRVPTLLFCGDADSLQPCNTFTDVLYSALPNATSKMEIFVPGATSAPWTKPTPLNGLPGQYALAFQKVFLEGDERWRSLLLTMPTDATQTTNIR